MAQRIYHIVWLLSLAMLVYALLFWGLLRRAMLVLFPMHKITGPRRWQPSADEDVIFGITPRDVPSHIDIAGFDVPVPVIIAALLTIQLFPLIPLIANRHRRRTRERNDQCLECGYPITRWRGHCPGCGVRVGPG